MLDGSWREAKKMFRKSPYLDKLPLVSFNPKQFIESELLATQTALQEADKETVNEVEFTPVGDNSRYTVRKTQLEHQLSTAEVATRVLNMCGEDNNAHLLDLWFDVFNYQYQKSVCQRNKGNPKAVDNYQEFKKNYASD